MKEFCKVHKKQLIIGAAIVAVLVLCIFLAFQIHRGNARQRDIDARRAQVEERVESFNKADARSGKVELLEQTLQDYVAYEKGEAPLKEVADRYEEAIATMRGYFTSEYDATLLKNTLEAADLEKEEALLSAKAGREQHHGRQQLYRAAEGPQTRPVYRYPGRFFPQGWLGLAPKRFLVAGLPHRMGWE